MSTSSIVSHSSSTQPQTSRRSTHFHLGARSEPNELLFDAMFQWSSPPIISPSAPLESKEESSETEISETSDSETKASEEPLSAEKEIRQEADVELPQALADAPQVLPIALQTPAENETPVESDIDPADDSKASSELEGMVPKTELQQAHAEPVTQDRPVQREKDESSEEEAIVGHLEVAKSKDASESITPAVIETEPKISQVDEPIRKSSAKETPNTGPAVESKEEKPKEVQSPSSIVPETDRLTSTPNRRDPSPDDFRSRRAERLERNRQESNGRDRSEGPVTPRPAEAISDASQSTPETTLDLQMPPVDPGLSTPAPSMDLATQGIASQTLSNAAAIVPVVASASTMSTGPKEPRSAAHPFTTGSVSTPVNRTNTPGTVGYSSLSPRQEVRLVQRVMRGFEQLANGDGQVRLRLHPPQLGSLQMMLRLDGSQMSATLEVENTLARDAILENLPKLRERLAEQGIQVDQFEVQLAAPDSTSNRGESGDTRGSWFGNTSQGGGETSSESRRSPGSWRQANPRLANNSGPTEPIRNGSGSTSGLDVTA